MACIQKAEYDRNWDDAENVFILGRQLRYLQYKQQGILYGAINTKRKRIFTKNTAQQFVFAESFRTRDT